MKYDSQMNLAHNDSPIEIGIDEANTLRDEMRAQERENNKQTEGDTMTDAQKLKRILDHVFRFPHNVNLYDLLREVYGRDSDTNIGYLRSKEMLIDRKGFTWWWCDLDDANQEKVARIMLDRYGETLWRLFTDRTPVVDAKCQCLMTGEHTLSEHGCSEKWHQEHYWVT